MWRDYNGRRAAGLLVGVLEPDLLLHQLGLLQCRNTAAHVKNTLRLTGAVGLVVRQDPVIRIIRGEPGHVIDVACGRPVAVERTDKARRIERSICDQMFERRWKL